MSGNVEQGPCGSKTRRLQVWGAASGSAQRLLAELPLFGWQLEECGWPDAGPAAGADEADLGLVVLADSSSEQLMRLQTLLEGRHRPWIFLCEPQELSKEPVRAMLARFAYAYLYLPGDVRELDRLLHHADMMASLWAGEGAHDGPAAASSTQHDAGEDEDEMVGTTPVMLALFKTIRRVAQVDVSVLIRGESGTGKELIAQAIHERSPRASGPFMPVNCGALPPELIQSELFGHEKGAFTGASQRKIGYVEGASGGTLLLDEIGDLPLSLQVHLLRFLETGKIQRVGGTREILVDVRVLSATHVPLEQAIRAGRFREDLYHRLNVVTVQAPPLRERLADIDVLARFFFRRFANERAPQVRGISHAALMRLRQHSWPGNVRELINRMRRALVLCEGRLIGPADLGLEHAPETSIAQTLDVARAEAEREQIRISLDRNRQVVTAAARELNISRVTLYRLMEKHKVNI